MKLQLVFTWQKPGEMSPSESQFFICEVEMAALHSEMTARLDSEQHNGLCFGGRGRRGAEEMSVEQFTCHCSLTFWHLALFKWKGVQIILISLVKPHLCYFPSKSCLGCLSYIISSYLLAFPGQWSDNEECSISLIILGNSIIDSSAAGLFGGLWTIFSLFQVSS